MLETDCAIVDENRSSGHRQAVLYTRVSSKDQERGGFSIPAQRQLLKRYARDRGLDVVAEFSDVETAGKAGRAKFGDMVRLLRTQRTCKVILVEKTDRLYRNLKDWVTLDELDVEVHMVKEGVVLSDESISSEKFVHGIKVLVAKNYLDILSEEVRKGLNEKVRQGHWPARAPVGYLNIVGPEGKKIIVPDPAQAPLVTKVFEWCANDGHSISELTKMAREVGLVSVRTSEPLHRSRIHAMLRNPIYMGEFDWKGKRHQGAHEPLVSRELWEGAQEVLSGRAPCRRKARQRHQFSFSGLVRCGVCADVGKRFLLVGEIKKGRYIYYRCEECKRCGRASYIREEKIADAYANALSQVDPNDELLDAAASALNDDDIESDERSLSNLKAELSALDDLLDMAYEDRLAGRIDPSHFDQKALGWRSQMNALRQEIDELEAASPRTDRPFALELEQLVELFRQSENGSKKRRLVESLHSNSVWRDGTLDVEWKAV